MPNWLAILRGTLQLFEEEEESVPVLQTYEFSWGELVPLSVYTPSLEVLCVISRHPRVVWKGCGSHNDFRLGQAQLVTVDFQMLPAFPFDFFECILPSLHTMRCRAV